MITQKIRSHLLIIAILIFANSLISLAGDSKEQLVKIGVATVEDGENRLLAITFENKNKWHTYWKNPGDAGLAVQTSFFSKGQEIKLQSLEWPAPQRYLESDTLVGYGFSGEYALFFKLDPVLANSNLTIKLKWLACKNICIPGKREIEGNLSNYQFTTKSKLDLNWSKNKLTTHLQKVPAKIDTHKNLELFLSRKKNSIILQLTYTLKNITKQQAKTLFKKKNLLTPFTIDPFGFRHEKLYHDGKSTLYGKANIEWEGEYEEPPLDLPTDGQFKKPYILKFIYIDPTSKTAKVIEQSFDTFIISSEKTIDQFYNTLAPITATKKETETTPSTAKEGDYSIWMLMLFAMLGGLILNIMPCVLPIISLKLFGMIRHRNMQRSKLIRHNLFYSLGVVSTFWVLAAVVMALKLSGEEVGWGFHLQSPQFVTIMAIVIFILSLNFFGLFEFITPGGKTLGSVDAKDNFSGDFMGGVLATILSTPCSAPFLGTALTFAFTTSIFNIFLMFTMIGIGLALPFIITGIFPQMIRFMPKPGNWMNHFKKFLGVTLLLTTVWLIDVLIALDSDRNIMILLAITFTLILAAFVYKKYLAKNKAKLIVVFILPLITSAILLTKIESRSSTIAMEISSDKSLKWIPWSKPRMQEFKQQEKLVFMDFTAKWCFTCKINEHVVINTDDFTNLTKKYDLQLLIGDWTNRNPKIGRWLKSQGVVGVPAYFIQKKDGTLINLGETITISEIEKHLR